ncbi:MAG: FUSC family protein [Candidatus Nanopelagicales bacterium]
MAVDATGSGIGSPDASDRASLGRVILPDARATARSVRRITESRAAGRGLRVAIVMPLLLAFFEVIHRPQGAFLASFATLSMLVIGDFAGPRRERFISILVTGGAGAVTLAIGALLADYAFVLVPAALVLGTTVALLGVLRGFMARATIPILLPFFLAATSAYPIRDLPQMELGWCVGSVVAAIAAITMWPYFPRARLTEAICDAMHVDARAIRSYFDTPGRAGDPAAPAPERADSHADRLGPVTTSMDRVRELFAGQLKRPGNSYRRERFLVALVEELRRLRIGLLTQLPRVPADPPSRDRDLAGETADALDHAADHLKSGHDDLAAFGMLNEGRIVHRARVVDSMAHHLAEAEGAAANRVVRDSFPVRSLSMLAIVPVRDASVAHGDEAVPHITFRGRRMPTTLSPRGPWHRVKGELSWSAPWFRNSFRLGLALALALTVVEITGVQRGYWVVLGTLSVMRLDLLSTGRTAWQVVQGQLLGFGLGVLIIPLTVDRHWLAWALLPPLAFAQGYVANNKGIIVQQMMFTALLVDLVMVTSPRRDIAILRLTDVLIGLAVAILVSVLVFPRGLVPRVQASVSTAVVAAGELLVAQTRLLSARVLSDQQGAPAANEAAMAQADDLKVRAAIEQAAETVDLAVAQGVPSEAEILLWARAINLVEFMTYVADVIAPVRYRGQVDPRDERAAADLVVAAKDIAGRVHRAVNALLEASTDLPPGFRLPDPGVYPSLQPGAERPTSAGLQQAQISIATLVDRWAQDRRADMADRAVHLAWALGWLNEIEGIASSAFALLDVLQEARVDGGYNVAPGLRASAGATA